MTCSVNNIFVDNDKLRKIAMLAIYSPINHERESARSILIRHGIYDPKSLFERRSSVDHPKFAQKKYNTIYQIIDFIDNIDAIKESIDDDIEQIISNALTKYLD